MVLLLSTRNTSRTRQSNQRPISVLIATLSLKGSHKKCDIDLYFKQKGLDLHLKRRLWEVLHYFVTPNSTEAQLRRILAEITEASFFPSQLWVWIGSWEEPCAKVRQCINERNISLLGELLHHSPQYVWGFVDEKEYYNVAHAAVDADLLDFTVLLCRSTDAGACVGLNQCNFQDETPAHMAARQLKMTHLRQLVNCEWVDLLVLDPIGRTSIHTLLSSLLWPSAWGGKSMMDVISIVRDALARCHRLAACRDHSGWTVADYALRLQSVGMVTVAIQPILSVDSMLSRASELREYLTALLKHAILKNNPGLLSCVYPFFVKHIVSGSTAEQSLSKSSMPRKEDTSIYSLIEIVEFVIFSGRVKSLHFICSDERTAIALRQLTLLGWSPLPYALTPDVRSASSDGSMLTNLLRYFPGDIRYSGHGVTSPGICGMFDNMFSIAAYFGDVDALRSLSMSTGSVKLVIRKRFKRNDPFSYHFNRQIYNWNPLVAAVLGRKGGMRHSRNIAWKAACLAALTYLLEQTQFIDIINVPQRISDGSSSNKISSTGAVSNALVAACTQQDIEAARVLLSHGADPLYSIPVDETDYVAAVAILKNHLNAAASLRSEIDSMGLSQRAIDRAAKLASQEVASLSKMEEEARNFLDIISSDDLEAVASDAAKCQLPDSHAKLLVFVGRICDVSPDVDLCGGGIRAPTSLSNRDAALLSKILFRPSSLLRAAIECMAAMKLSHVYTAKNTSSARLIQRLRKEDSAQTPDCVENRVQMEDTKRRIISAENSATVAECVEFIGNRLNNVLRGNEQGLKKKSGSHAVVRAFCLWVLRMHDAIALISSNMKKSYITTAGVLQLELNRQKEKISLCLDLLLSSPRSVNALHAICPESDSSRRGQGGTMLWLMLLDSIEKKYFDEPVIVPNCICNCRYIDVRTKPYLLCLQNSKISLSASWLWDLMGTEGAVLGKETISVCRRQLNLILGIKYCHLFMLEDAAGIERMIEYRYNAVKSLQDNHDFISIFSRESFVLGRSSLFDLLLVAVSRLDVQCVLLILLGGIFDHTDSANVQYWTKLIENVPNTFSNTDFCSVLEHEGKCGVCVSNSGVLFTGVDCNIHTPLGTESLDARCSLMREILMSYRKAHYDVGSSQSIIPVICEGNLCCRFASKCRDFFDPDIWPSMDAFELSQHYTVTYSLDAVGSGALSGLIMLVRKDDSKPISGLNESVESVSGMFKPRSFSISDISRVLSVAGEWMEISSSSGRAEKSFDCHGVWYHSFLGSGESRFIQCVAVTDRFLYMPSSIFDGKLIALQCNSSWFKECLKNASPYCSRYIDCTIRELNGDRSSVGLANFMFSRNAEDSYHFVDNELFSEIRSVATADIVDISGLLYCGIHHAAQCGNSEVLRYFLQEHNGKNSSSQASSPLIVWHLSSSEGCTVLSGSGGVSKYYPEINTKVFTDGIYSEACRRLVSAERRYDALLVAVEALCPSVSPRTLLDSTLWFLRVSIRVCEYHSSASIVPFMRLLQKVVKNDSKAANCSAASLYRSDCAFILRILYLNNITDDTSFRSYTEAFVKSPLEHLEQLIRTVCERLNGDAAVVDTVLQTVWTASPRSKILPNNTAKIFEPFAIPEDIVVAVIGNEAVSGADLWSQWATALLHLTCERRSVESAQVVLAKLQDVGLLRAFTFWASQKVESTLASLERVDSDISDEFSQLDGGSTGSDPWFGQASAVVSEVILATSAYSQALKVLNQVQSNISIVRHYERTSLLSTFNRKLDVFGVPYGYDNSANSEPRDHHSWESGYTNAEDPLVPLGTLPILCLDTNDVAKVLTGSNGYTCASLNIDHGVADVRNGLPLSLIETLFDLSVVALRGLHPHELFYRLYKLLDANIDKQAMDIKRRDDFISSLDQFRSILASLWEGYDEAGVVSEETVQLCLVARHLSVYAAACINHLKDIQFQYIEQDVLLWSIHQQKIYLGNNSCMPTSAWQHRVATEAYFDNIVGKVTIPSVVNMLSSMTVSEVNRYGNCILNSLDLFLKCVRSGSTSSVVAMLGSFRVSPVDFIRAYDTWSKHSTGKSILNNVDDVPLLPSVINISNYSMSRAIAIYIRSIWCASAAQPSLKTNVDISNILSIANWKLGCILTPPLSIPKSSSDRSDNHEIGVSTVASEGRPVSLRMYIDVLEAESRAVDWSPLHSAYYGMESKTMYDLLATRLGQCSLERRITNHQNTRRSALILISSVADDGVPDWLWSFVAVPTDMSIRTTGRIDKLSGSVLDIAAQMGDWDTVTHILLSDNHIGAFFYLTKFLSKQSSRHRKETASCSSSELLHYAIADQRVDIFEIWNSVLTFAKDIFSQHYAHYFTVLVAMHRMLLSTRQVVFALSAYRSKSSGSFLFPSGFEVSPENLRSRYTHSLLHDAILAGDEQLALLILKMTTRVHIEMGNDVTKLPLVYHDTGLYSYAIDNGMVAISSELTKWPFAVATDELHGLPKPVVNHHSLTKIVSFAFRGRVHLLQQELEKGLLANQKLPSVGNLATEEKVGVLFDAFRLAVWSHHDRCAVIVLRSLFKICPDDMNASIKLESAFADLNLDNRLLRHLATHKLGHSLQILLLSKYSAGYKSLKRFMTLGEMKNMFELCTANGSTLGGLAVLKCCRLGALTPPVVASWKMSNKTFQGILRVLLNGERSRNKNSASKEGPFNLYYSGNARNRETRQGIRASTSITKGDDVLLEREVVVQREGNVVTNKENCTIVAPIFLEPKSRPSVVILRARGKVALFRASTNLNIANRINDDTNDQKHGLLN